MSDVPLFTDTERKTISDIVMDDRFERYGKFILNIRDFSASALHADQVASAYLLTNAILMTKASQKILKFVCLDGDNRDDLMSGINILRSYFRGDFSSLRNIRTWEGILRASAQLPGDIVDTVEKTIEFFEGSEIGDSSLSYHRAEVAFGLSSAAFANEGEFNLSEEHIFLRRLDVLSGSKPVITNEIFFGAHNAYQLGDRGKNTCISLSLADWQGGLAEWMGNIKTMLSGEFYSKA